MASLLGIDRVRDALRAIEGGSVDPAAFDAVGDDWDIEERARGWLGRLGLAACRWTTWSGGCRAARWS